MINHHGRIGDRGPTRTIDQCPPNQREPLVRRLRGQRGKLRQRTGRVLGGTGNKEVECGFVSLPDRLEVIKLGINGDSCDQAIFEIEPECFPAPDEPGDDVASKRHWRAVHGDGIGAPPGNHHAATRKGGQSVRPTVSFPVADELLLKCYG